MGPQDSDRAFRQNLRDFCEDSSDPPQAILRSDWGSNDTLASFATLLQNEILVISEESGFARWTGLNYITETRTKRNK